MPKWLVELRGEGYDIDRLGAVLPDEWTIASQNDRQWLTAPLDDVVDATTARASLIDILSLANAYARVKFEDFRLVQAGNIRGVGDDGAVMDYVFVGTVGLTGRAFTPTVVDVGVEAAPTPVEMNWLELVQKHQPVQSALKYWASPKQDWANLYKVYEVVERDSRSLVDSWMGQEQRKQFVENACDARHGVPQHRHYPPMTEQHGYDFVRTLLRKWLDWKQSQHR